MSKRYIDADALKQKKVYSAERHECVVPVAEIDWQPTADVVEVVRCKDCRYCKEAHYEEEGEKPYIKLQCKWSNYSHQPNDYCSYGERREE